MLAGSLAGDTGNWVSYSMSPRRREQDITSEGGTSNQSLGTTLI